MASLATALTAMGAKFSDKLTYVPGMAPRSANRASLEHGGMQVIFLILIESMLFVFQEFIDYHTLSRKKKC